jgi:hypothetical protein
MSTSLVNVWRYRPVMTADINRPARIVGYDVEATDGPIGAVDGGSIDPARQYVVVDTATWIAGKKRLIPVGVIDRIDHADQKVYVQMTRHQIKDAPDFDEVMTTADDAFFDEYSSYYDPYDAGRSK